MCYFVPNLTYFEITSKWFEFIPNLTGFEKKFKVCNYIKVRCAIVQYHEWYIEMYNKSYLPFERYKVDIISFYIVKLITIVKKRLIIRFVKVKKLLVGKSVVGC